MYVSCTRIRPRCRIHPQIHLGSRAGLTLSHCAQMPHPGSPAPSHRTTVHTAARKSQQNPRQRKCMLDICITASSPSLAPRARARRQASALSGRERGRWTAPLSNSAAGDPVCPPITRRAPLILAQRAAAGGFSELPLSLSGVSRGSVQMKGNVEPRVDAARRSAYFRKRGLLFCAVRLLNIANNLKTRDCYVGFESEESQHN